MDCHRTDLQLQSVPQQFAPMQHLNQILCLSQQSLNLDPFLLEVVYNLATSDLPDCSGGSAFCA